MLTRLRARFPGAANYSPMPFNFGYGVPPAQGGFVTLPPADTMPQSASGATRESMRNAPRGLSIGGDTNVTARAIAEARATFGGVDSAALADAIARRLEAALAPVYDGMRYATFNSIPFTVGAADQVIVERPTTKRVYMFLICTHPTQDLFVAFDRPATVLDTPIRAGDGFFEWLFVIPQNVIHLISNAGGTTGVAIFAELDPRAANRDPSQSTPERIEAAVGADALPSLASLPQSAQIIPLPIATPSYVAPVQSSVPAQPISAPLPATAPAPEPVAGPIWTGEGWTYPPDPNAWTYEAGHS